MKSLFLYNFEKGQKCIEKKTVKVNNTYKSVTTAFALKLVGKAFCSSSNCLCMHRAHDLSLVDITTMPFSECLDKMQFSLIIILTLGIHVHG